MADPSLQNAEQKIQSNGTKPFWNIVAKLDDNSVVNDPKDFVAVINRCRERVKLLGLFFGDEYRGTVELLDPQQRLILVRRTQTDFGEDLKPIAQRIIILVGWQSTIGGRNVKAILELHPDGSLVMRNHDGRGTH